jgi:hypothetical protein
MTCAMCIGRAVSRELDAIGAVLVASAGNEEATATGLGRWAPKRPRPPHASISLAGVTVR